MLMGDRDVAQMDESKVRSSCGVAGKRCSIGPSDDLGWEPVTLQVTTSALLVRGETSACL